MTEQKASPQKIGLFVPDLQFGGVQRVMLNLAGGFLATGCSVDLVAADACGPFRSQLPAGVRLVELNSSRVLSAAPKLARYLRAEKPDVLIAAMTHSNLAALAARKWARTKTPVIATEHIGMSDLRPHARRMRERVMPVLARLFLGYADCIVAVSEGVAEQLAKEAKIARDRIAIISNPVLNEAFFERVRQPLEHPWFAAGAPPVVLSAGRLSYEKDYATLLRAFALLRKQLPARLMILGEGPQRRELEALARELAIAEDVALPGYVVNPYPYMARAGVFALSSRWEGFGMVLVEALAAGAPVVATDCPTGPREVLAGGSLGRLVPMGDVAALAAALRETLSSPKPKIERNELERFEVNHAAERYLELISRIKSRS